MEKIVVATELKKYFGELAAVNGISFHVNRGEIFTVLGPNGSGKTTTIKMLMGLLRPTFGSAEIGGMDCFEDSIEVKRKVGYVPDEPSFYQYLKGVEIVRFVGQMQGVPLDIINEHTINMAKRFDLYDALNSFADDYSRGMKKKLAVICATVHEPDLLILDEPTNGLDPMSTRELHNVMREHTARGGSILFSTHLLDQAEKLSTRVAIMRKGEIVAIGALDELKGRLGEDKDLEEIFFSVLNPEEDKPADSVLSSEGIQSAE